MREQFARRSQATVLEKSQSRKWFFFPNVQRDRGFWFVLFVLGTEVCFMGTELLERLSAELTGLQRAAK